MISNVFQTSEALSPERLTWITELLKHYCTKQYPESLHHSPRFPTPPFYFLVTGEGLYSLVDRRCFRQWEILLSLPPVQCVCSQRELRMRGLRVEPLTVKYSDQIQAVPDKKGSVPDPYWDRFLDIVSNDTAKIGALSILSPYMHRGTRLIADLLERAVERDITPELYSYLDGVHASHRDQRPAEVESVGTSFETVFNNATSKGISPLYLVCARCATARGYSTFRGPKGKIISSCTLPSMKIRTLNQIIRRFKKDHPIVSGTSFSLKISPYRKYPSIKPEAKGDPPSLVLLVTGSPYGTENTFGALSFAIASAHEGIPTSVIFIEDGVYTITGIHEGDDRDMVYSLQEIIESTSNQNNLEYYSYIPSIQNRGLVTINAMKEVQPLDAHEFPSSYSILLRPWSQTSSGS